MKTISINGVIGWDVTANSIREALQAANGDDVTFEISSPGGYIGEGLSIFNQIRNYAGKTTAVLSGYAMSMGAYIPQACDEVQAEDNAVYMIHMASGGVWGDYKEIQKYGTYLEGLSDISAKQFVKSTGCRGVTKSLAEVKQMMEETTYLFGDDMVAHGFVDSLRAGSNSDPETSMLTAKAAYADCEAKMLSDHARMKADLQQANALMCAMNLTPPAASAAGISSKEGLQMDLKALLAANPQAQAEFDTAVSAAEAKGKVVGSEEMKATVTAVAPFLSNKSYPSQVGEMALKVLTGEQQKTALDSMVAMADMMKEMQKGTGAAAGTQAAGETAGQHQEGVTVDATNVGDEAGLAAAIQLAKGGDAA